MVAIWGPDSGIGDVLEQGEDYPRQPRLRTAVLAAVLLGAGAFVGYQAHGLVPEGATADTSDQAPTLVAGMVEADARLTSDGFVLPLHNGSDSVVKVLDVDVEGWAADAGAVSIPPGSWGDVELDLTVDCRTTPYATQDVIVRVISDGRAAAEVLPMPGLPSVLNEEVSRRCGGPSGRVPARAELLGTWLVERAHQFAGEMLLRLNRDGTFAMDSDVGLFSDEPGAYGTFTLSGAWLTLRTRGGRDCAPGARGHSRVLLLEDGRLRIRYATYDYAGSWCRVEADEVWIAKRVSAAADSGPASDEHAQAVDESPDLVPTVPGIQP